MAGCQLSVIRLPEAGFSNGCRGVGLDARLAGGRSDPRIVWLEPDSGARRIWPVGFTARFAPDLEIVDADGTIVMREGDHVSGACVAGPADDPGSVLRIDSMAFPRR